MFAALLAELYVHKGFDSHPCGRAVQLGGRPRGFGFRVSGFGFFFATRLADLSDTLQGIGFGFRV